MLCRYVLEIIRKKHHAIDQLSWLLNKRVFIKSNVVETLKGISNTLQNLEFVPLRVDEIVWRHDPPGKNVGPK